MKKLVLYILIITMSLSCRQHAEKEKFMIPKGYTGRITIFFNQNKGSKKEYVEDVRIYRIPASGVLVAQFEENYGYQSIEKNEIAFVFYDSSTEKEEAIRFKPLNPDPDKIYVLNGRTGSVNDHPYYQCIIDKLKNIQNYYIRNEQGYNSEPRDMWEKIFAEAGINQK